MAVFLEGTCSAFSSIIPSLLHLFVENVSYHHLRAMGLPPFGDFISAMEVADGSHFGMPVD